MFFIKVMEMYFMYRLFVKLAFKMGTKIQSNQVSYSVKQ